MAAENGYLPAQNSDFGLGVLLDMLGGSSCKKAKNAIGLIKTAIKEGREYACTPEWPTRMESIEVLEAMQTLWRRIGEGDAELVREYAGKAEMMINSRIYWPVSPLGTGQKAVAGHFAYTGPCVPGFVSSQQENNLAQQAAANSRGFSQETRLCAGVTGGCLCQ